MSNLPAVVIEPRSILSGQLDQEERLQALWDEAALAWLSSKERRSGSRDTKRAYQASVKFFFAFCQKRPWMVGGADVIAWQKDMRDRGLAETTINLRLAGLSSFYAFCSERFSVPGPNGREMFLAERNPVARVERSHIDPYGKVDGLSSDEVHALLRRVDRSTLQGLRDFALISCYVYCGRRSAEIARLRWGDLSSQDGVQYYKWTGKGGKSATIELPLPAYNAILAFVKAAGREMKSDDFIFTALSDVAYRLPNVHRDPTARPEPITGAMVNRIVKKWCKRAGLDPERIHTHTLRHTAADLRIAAGEDLLELSQFLGHSSTAITQIYLTKKKKSRDPHWAKVEAMIGLE